MSKKSYSQVCTQCPINRMHEGKILKQLIKARGTVEEAAVALDVTRSTMYNYYALETIDPDFKKLLKEKLNIEIGQNVSDENQNEKNKMDNMSVESETFLEKRRKKKNADNPYLVPFVDVPAQAGYKKAYDHIDYIQTLKHYPILPNVDPHGATWRYFQVEGDSMENPRKSGDEIVDPGLKDNDVILASLVIKDDWETFSNLYTYVVVTNDILTIKDVDREMFKEHKKWVLISRNPIYEPMLIDIKDVKQLWLFRRRVSNTLPKAYMYNLDAIKKKLQTKLKKTG